MGILFGLTVGSTIVATASITRYFTAYRSYSDEIQYRGGVVALVSSIVCIALHAIYCIQLLN